MYIYQNDRYTIVFGDQTTAFPAQSLYGIHSSYNLAHQPCFAVTQMYLPQYAIALKQVHGDQGVVIATYEQAALFQPYSQEGDFLVTPVVGIALGVATADCVPLILYDPVQHVSAVVHAGYRGAAAGVAGQALQKMAHLYGTQAHDVQVWMGPCARSCCYQVASDFVRENFNDVRAHAYMHVRDGRWYFDLVLYLCATLRDAGVVAFMLDAAVCTIHTHVVCSYRRDGATALRQMSWCMLKPVS